MFHDDDLARLGRRPERIARDAVQATARGDVAPGAADPDARRGVRGVRARDAGERGAEGAGPRPPAIGALVERVAAIVAARGRGRARAGVVVQPHGGRAWMRRLPARPARGCCSSARRRCRCGGPGRRRCCARRAAPGAGALHAGAGRRPGSAAATWSTSGPSTSRRAVAACRDMRVDGMITNDPARPRRRARAPENDDAAPGTGPRRSSDPRPVLCGLRRQEGLQLGQRDLVHRDVLGVVAAARADAREPAGLEKGDHLVADTDRDRPLEQRHACSRRR